MIIKNNMSAVRSLNQLKKNDSALAKDLKKISSGKKVNGASDGASEYSISKGMDVLIRSLSQDIDNTKSGRDLIATAEGGIQEVINNLRDMKAMAINSANDHNTDLDRETLEKDFLNRMDTIKDIAATTNFNGKLLLNGAYGETYDRVETVNVPHYEKKVITMGPPSYTVGNSQPSTYTYVQDNKVQGLMRGFAPAKGCYPQVGEFGMTGERADYGFTSGSSWSSTTFSVQMDFSQANLQGGTLPDVLDGQGVTIGCAACSQYINIKFDANSTTSSIQRTGFYSNIDYTIGVQGLQSLDDLPKAIFDGIATLDFSTRKNHALEGDEDSADRVLIDGHHDLHIEKNGDSYFLVKNGPDLEMIDRGTMVGVSADDPGVKGRVEVTQPVQKEINAISYTIEERHLQAKGQPLIIHTGAKANQNLAVHINSMHPIAMGLNGTKIHPRDNAIAALDTLDKALEYALNEVTRMGAYRSRLSQTESTLTTNHENTTASMSAIADADIAKLMTQYTKDSVLTQSAQLMLAQANQTSSSVLSLLQ